MDLLTPGSMPSRFVAFSLLILVLLGAFILMVAPIHSLWQARQARIETQYQLLARFEAAARRDIERDTASVQDTPQKPLLITAPSELAATAALQKKVKAAFEGSSMPLSRLNFLPAEEGVDVTQLQLSFQARGALPDLQKAIHILENAAPPVFVEAAFVRRETPPKLDDDSQTSTSGTNNQERQLIADITVVGLLGRL